MVSVSISSVLILTAIIAMAVVHVTVAQNNPQDFLNSHNTARSAVGVGPMAWNDTVAAYAYQRIINCRFTNFTLVLYGENLYWGGSGWDWSANDAVNAWIAEKSNYDYNSNICTIGTICGHYKQVVWRDSVRLGCARVKCGDGSTLINCDYDPPGDYVGQRPY